MGTPNPGLGTLNVLPREIWQNITKYMDGKSIAMFKAASGSVMDELKAIKAPVPNEKWVAKMAKFAALKKGMAECNLNLNHIYREVQQAPVLSPEQAQMITLRIIEGRKAYEQVANSLYDSVKKMESRKELKPEQQKELKEFKSRCEIVEKTYAAEVKRILDLVAEIARRQSPKK